MPETPRVAQEDGTGLIALDPWLAPYADRLRDRYAHYRWVRSEIERNGGLLGPVSQGHHFFGLNRGERDGSPGVWYREWAPGATYLALIGDFNAWDRGANALSRDAFGTWSAFMPDDRYGNRLVHGSRVKVHVGTSSGGMDRIPAYARRVVQEPDTHDYVAQYWCPSEPFAWRYRSASRTAPAAQRSGLRIYEAHVGMAQEEGRVGTFAEFTANNLTRIAALGYNAIQLMAVMEHPYYGSFGYHVSNFYAVSSRFGTPDDLKLLIDTAHGLGLCVIMDLIHSHAVKNVNEGLNRFDGTDHQYFHAGGRGEHPAWDSLLFDYSKYEVQRFLLSNVRFWLEEYRFDGFRFDGVTSMLYLDHGLGKPFATYEDYFDGNVDRDALVYLMLANELLHSAGTSEIGAGNGADLSLRGPSEPSERWCPGPDGSAVSIAEDVSGMVGMARPVAEGGCGFDYRLAMGVPDYWIRLLKTTRDEDWNLAEIYHTLLNRRFGEKHVGYVESHDQALVGDKTIAFWLMDQDMYWGMSRSTPNVVVDRGIALHKMIRLITFSLAGEAYLNFMGNEFGHPEWIDFPRQENNNSFHYARRQWSLAEREDLRYRGLMEFDRAMNAVDATFGLLEDPLIEQLALHEDTRQLVYRRGPLVFAFNFHPTESYAGLRLPVPDAADYRVVLNTDDARFEGFGRVTPDTVYPKQDVAIYGRRQSVQVYLPSRSAQVLAPMP